MTFVHIPRGTVNIVAQKLLLLSTKRKEPSARTNAECYGGKETNPAATTIPSLANTVTRFL
jgi:hypothetical protein